MLALIKLLIAVILSFVIGYFVQMATHSVDLGWAAFTFGILISL